MDSSKAGGKSVRSDAASQQIRNCQLEGFFPEDCLCEGVAGQACSCFSSMCLMHRLFPRATGEQGFLLLMPESLCEGKTPIQASRHCLTLSENAVAGQEADLDRVVIVIRHLRPSALLSTSGMTLVKLCRLPWGTVEPEEQHQHPTEQWDSKTYKPAGSLGKGSYPYHQEASYHVHHYWKGSVIKSLQQCCSSSFPQLLLPNHGSALIDVLMQLVVVQCCEQGH